MPTPARDRDTDPERQRTVLSEPEEHNPLDPVSPRRHPDEEDRRRIPDDEDEPRRPPRRNKFEKKIAAERAKRGELEQRNGHLEGRIREMEELLAQTNSRSVEAHESALKIQAEKAQRDIEEAYSAGDAKAAAEGHRRLSQVTVQEEQVRQAKQAPPAPQRPRGDEFDIKAFQPKTRDWISDNKWFEENPAMRRAAVNVHFALIEAGWKPETKKYFSEVEAQVKRLFPTEFDDDDDDDEGPEQPEDGDEPRDEEEHRPSRSPVAVPSRGPPASRQPTKASEVRLTQGQKDFCRNNGIAEEAYAAGILKRRSARA